MRITDAQRAADRGLLVHASLMTLLLHFWRFVRWSTGEQRAIIRAMSGLKWLTATLVVAVLSAQAATLVHQLDPADHEPGQACEVCLASAVFGGADAGSFEHAAILASRDANDVEPRQAFSSAARNRYQARAPPSAS